MIGGKEEWSVLNDEQLRRTNWTDLARGDHGIRLLMYYYISSGRRLASKEVGPREKKWHKYNWFKKLIKYN